MSKSWIHWTTPAAVYSRLLQVAPVLLDPCSNPMSKVPADLKLMRENGDDGLAADWRMLTAHRGPIGGLIYVNPPFDKPAPWINKVAQERASRQPPNICVLTPVRPSARWHETLMEAQPSLIALWGPGRVAFDNPPEALVGKRTSSNVEIMLWWFCDFSSLDRAFREAFSDTAYIYAPRYGELT